MRLITLLMWNVDGYAVKVTHHDVKTGTIIKAVRFADATAAAAYPEVDWLAPDPGDPRPLVAIGSLGEEGIEEEIPEPEEGGAHELWTVKLTVTVRAWTGEEAIQHVQHAFTDRGFDDERIQSLEVEGGKLAALEDGEISTVRCQFCGQETAGITAHLHQMAWVCAECWDERLRASE